MVENIIAIIISFNVVMVFITIMEFALFTHKIDILKLLVHSIFGFVVFIYYAITGLFLMTRDMIRVYRR